MKETYFPVYSSKVHFVNFHIFLKNFKIIHGCMARQWCIDFLKCIQSLDKTTGLGLPVVTINPFNGNYKLVYSGYPVKIMTCKTNLIQVYLQLYRFHTITLSQF